MQRERFREIQEDVREQRAFYSQMFESHFGHLEPEQQIELMRAVKDAFDRNTTVRDLNDTLADKMLVVGAVKGTPLYEISIEQQTVATRAYTLEREMWDTLIAQADRKE